MKSVLFISKSRLSYNLACAILPLVPFKVDLCYAAGLADAAALRAKKPPVMAVIDWNVLAEGGIGAVSGLPKNRVLLHPGTVTPGKDRLQSLAISACLAKPLTTGALAGMITQWCRR